MKQIFLDTETTGLDPAEGHRIVEVAAVAYFKRVPIEGDDGVFHFFLDPERDIEAEAERVHGITADSLKGKPKFADIAADLADFLRGSEVIIHNAEFDRVFLDSEFHRCDLPPLEKSVKKITDSLLMARKMYPGMRNSLDALCERLGIDISARSRHSALLDTNLLAKVYLAMTRGQSGLELPEDQRAARFASAHSSAEGIKVIILPAAAEESALHESIMRDIRAAKKSKAA